MFDPITKVFQRLERLRLVVSQARGREPGAGQAATGDARLARMHRLVQDVVRARLDADDLASREVVVHQLAYSRAGWIEAHWGQRGPRLGAASSARHRVPPDRAGRPAGGGNRRPHRHPAHAHRPPAQRARPLAAFRGPFRWVVERDPRERRLARGLSVSYDRLGDLAMSGGDPAAAQRYYEDGLRIAKRLADAAPENADYARDLSISYNKLGDLARSGGDPAAAWRYYEDGLRIAKRLADAVPENADYARDLSVSYNKLGDLARSGGDPAAARRYHEDGLTIAKRLADAAPDNADYARDLWVWYWRMAALAENSSSRSEASMVARGGARIRRALGHETAGCLSLAGR